MPTTSDLSHATTERDDTILPRAAAEPSNAVETRTNHAKGAPDPSQLSEYSFRRAIERAVRAGLAACDLDGHQTYVNQAFCDLVGYSEAELVGARPPFPYWPAGEYEQIANAFGETLSGDAPDNGFELRFQHKDGHVIDVLVAVAPLIAEDGSTQGWLASVSDITDQKGVAAALRSSERQLRFTLEAARVGTWHWNMVTSEVEWSDNLEVIHGMTAGSFESSFSSFLADVRPDHRERVQNVISETVESGTEYRIEYPVVPKEGQTIWVEGRGRVIRDEIGRPVRMAGICMDITDRKEAEMEVQRLNADLRSKISELKAAEQQLRELNETLEARVRSRTEALEDINAKMKIEISERIRTEGDLERVNTELRRSNRELRDFVHAASHDLKEPLRKITYFVDLLNTDDDPSVPPTESGYAGRIQSSAIRMTELINDLLMYAQLRSQERPFKHVDLDDVLSEALSDLAIQIQDEDGTVQAHGLPDLEGDRVQLRQLFQNLVANALKFHRPNVKPVVHIRAEPVQLNGFDACRIEVSDNGIGLDPTYVDRIFTPFQRLHDRDAYPGSGMGLAICRRIVERHGGEITASGQPGKGTTLIVTLPLQHRETAVAEGAAQTA